MRARDEELFHRGTIASSRAPNGMSTAPMSIGSRRFAVALSFSSDHRDFVKMVADSLALALGKERVFYDQFHEAELARVDLDLYLSDLYSSHSELLVVFLSPDYAVKHWANLEWRHIQHVVARTEPSRVMFVSFGHIEENDPLPINGYLNIEGRPAQEVAAAILERVGRDRAVASTLSTPITVESGTFHADISRIDRYAAGPFIGRDAELAVLADAWTKAQDAKSPRPHVISIVALGGMGKTSLVSQWAASLAAEGGQGCEAAFAWSFYSQGAREQMTVSSDLFLKEALTFFGDPMLASSARTAFDKGRRLAELVGERKTLLVLDGLEPLQYPPTSPQSGELKDPGISALLRGLAADNRGLCVVTTRYPVADLKAFRQKTALETRLSSLPNEAGVKLLRALGVTGSLEELGALVTDAKGHALTLSLLGVYLRDAHGGDVRKRSLVTLGGVEVEEEGHGVFRVMDAYVRWMVSEGAIANSRDPVAKSKREVVRQEGQRQLSVLRLLGLFDRPASADCLAALGRSPVIRNLTDALVDMTKAQWSEVSGRLEAAGLLTADRDAAGMLVSLDAHPLLRDYFARTLREQHPEAWRTAHRRLYEHLKITTKDKPEPTLEDLQPLCEAVVHGCEAGLQQEACDEVYFTRLSRRGEAYVVRRLGAIGTDLATVACFFEPPWSRLSPALRTVEQAWLLNEAAFCLRALGRLTEAVEPMRVALDMEIKRQDWRQAAVVASNLSELELTRGEVAGAVRDAENGVDFAERSGDPRERAARRTTLADALHQAGRRAEADALFRETEAMQTQLQPEYPLLYAWSGFRYCDLLLAVPERAAWQAHVTPKPGSPIIPPEAIALCRAVLIRAEETLGWAEQNNLALLDIALNHLTLGRVKLYVSILESSNSQLPEAISHVTAAVDGLRRAGHQDELAGGLLTRAWLRFVLGRPNGSESADADLVEAREIAERGTMLLHQADASLYRARLFGDVAALGQADTLIHQCGYLRRIPELATALLTVGSHSSPDQRRHILDVAKAAAPDDYAPLLDQLIESVKASGDIAMAMYLFLERARIRFRTRAYEQARWDFKMTLVLSTELGMSDVLAETEIELADLEYRSGLYHDAYQHLQHAMGLLPMPGNEERLGHIRETLNDLGRLVHLTTEDDH
jgi:tetratricopeptide (TPR) repeat protein